MEGGLVRQEVLELQAMPTAARFHLLQGGAEIELQPESVEPPLTPSAGEISLQKVVDYSLPRHELNPLDALKAVSNEYPLLTADQEKELGHLIQAGIAAENGLVEQYHSLSFEQFDAQLAKLLPVIETGRAAKDTFIKSNFRLVLKEASRYYQGSPLGERYGKADLVQEGMFGLIRAVERFDPNRGTKFSTFGTLWIRQALQRALQDKGSTIRIPVYYDEPLRKLSQLETQDKSDSEIQRVLEISAAELQNLRSVRTIRSSTSLDVPVGDDEAATLGEFIADPRSEAEYAGVLEVSEQEPEVSGEAPESGGPLLDALHSFLDKKGIALFKKIIARDELTVAEQRHRFRLMSLFEHPAIRAEIKEFDPAPEVDWRDEAACIGYAEAYVTYGSPSTKALRVQNCIGCAVRSQCRLYFKENKPERGYYSGSLSKDALNRKKRRRARRAAPAATS
jgi:RNA polymerase sigma factor (sigma-70 family)